MSNLMGESHDGLVFAGLDVVVDECDKCRVTSGNINIYILCIVKYTHKLRID